TVSPTYLARRIPDKNKTPPPDKNSSGTPSTQAGKVGESTAPLLKIPARPASSTSASPEDRPPRKPGPRAGPEAAKAVFSLPQTILDLQKTHPRFRPIQVQIHAGTLVLSAADFHADSLHEFARRLARLPGVERV